MPPVNPRSGSANCADRWLLIRDCVRPTFFRSAARGLHVPDKLTPEPAKHEARGRRASERPRVGCCEELGAAFLRGPPELQRAVRDWGMR